MQNAQQAQSKPDFDAGPLLNMYLASIDAWKKNCDALFHVTDEQPRQSSRSGQRSTIYERPSAQAQNTGAGIFRSIVEQQIEFCRFFGKRWEQYLDLSRISACETKQGYLLVVARGLFDGEVLQAFKCASAPSHLTEPDELHRVDLNINDGFARALELRSLVQMELEPFIIGVGKVRVDKSPEGIVVSRANDG